MTNLGGLCLELLSGKGLESAFLEGIGLKHETVLCHHGAVFSQDPHGNKDGPMAAQTSASSSRASAKWAQRRAKRSESLSGSMRQFLTPEVWKQVKQVASQHGCRKGVRWTLQPLMMIAAIMTWCAGETDADRFVLSRSFYVQIHCPKRQQTWARRLAAFASVAGFAHARLVGLLRCGGRASHLLADRMTMEGWLPLGCDGSRGWNVRALELEQSLGVQQGQIGTDAVVIALVSFTTGVLWSWRWGHPRRGNVAT